MTIKDIIADWEEIKDQRYAYLSLRKLAGVGIKDVEISLSKEFGETTIQIHRLIMEDGQLLWIEGEHEFAYIDSNLESVSQELLDTLHDERSKDDY